MTSSAPVSVSVIVASDDGARFLAETLDSILGQTLPVEQVAIVDDGSSDDTERVVRRYSDARIEYIKQEHAGVAVAHNTGLNAARGEFVTFLDAGACWRATFIERMHAFLAEDPTVACGFANFVRIPQAAGEVARDQFQNYPEIRRPVLLRDMPNAHGRIPKDVAFRALVACGDIPAYLPVMLFRRGMIESLRFEPALTDGADLHFSLRAFMQGGVIFTDEVLADVRRDDSSQAIHRLAGLKALAPQVTRVDIAAYQDRLVRAQIDAALYQTRSGRVRDGLQSYRDGLKLPGSRTRKLEGSLRLALALLKK